jgi:hypothetical protein
MADEHASSTGGARCAQCGRLLDAHRRHVRFRVPDPVLDIPEPERTARTWATETMMQVEGLGAFVRTLLPVRLTGGSTVTFGVWLAVPPATLHHALREWWAPTYPELVLDGFVANDVRPWGLLRRPAHAEVRNPDEVPYLVRSEDPLLASVLTGEFEHEPVLAALP